MKNIRIRALVGGLLVFAGMFVVWQSIQTKRAAVPFLESAISRSMDASGASATKQLPTLSRLSASRSNTPENMRLINEVELAPIWAVKFGEEFWRRQTLEEVREAPRAVGATVVNPPFSLGVVIGRVGHALVRNDSSGLPEVAAGNYLARFDGQGLWFSPFRPAEDQKATVAATEGRWN